MTKFKQGFYKPKNPEKFISSSKSLNEYSNLKLPQYRSSYELKFFKFCDLNPKIEKWSTEPFPIYYISPVDNKKHRYYIDILIIISSQKYLVEIKPFSQTQSPKNNNKYEILRYQVNLAKWKACQEFCNKNGYKFLIVTEKELGI